MARPPRGGHAFHMLDATKLKIGVDVMDDQHAALVELFNALERPQSDLAQLAPAFAGYAEFHFEEEEKLMAKFHDPEEAMHIGEHRDYREKVERMLKAALAGQPGVRDEMIRFTEAWLGEHILGTDKRLAEFLVRAGYRGRE